MKAAIAALVAVVAAATAVAVAGDKLHLVSRSAGDRGQWITETEMLALARAGVNFFDLTSVPTLFDAPAVPRVRRAYPTPSHQAETEGYIAQIDMARPQADLTTFSSFFTRFHATATGVAAAEWLFAQVQAAAANSSVITVYQVAHASSDQRSIVARFEGTDNSLPLVILGGHLDSINMFNETTGRSPGADDAGSGTVTLLEAFRILAASGFRPRHPVEFMWYALEEVGLVGSAEIADRYKNAGVEVYGMMELDMVGFTIGDASVRVMNKDEYVDQDLTDFVRLVIAEYTSFATRDRQCTYACSDHASWGYASYPATAIFEAVPNPRWHQAKDDLPLISWPNIRGFTQLALGYIVELSYGV